MMLSAETSALRRIGKEPDFYGNRIAYAYGCDQDELQPNPSAHYNFEIMLDGAELVCSIDVYSALGGLGLPSGEFDVDAWNAALIHLRGSANRANYSSLASVARAILRGYRVVLPDGEEFHVAALYSCQSTVKS